MKIQADTMEELIAAAGKRSGDMAALDQLVVTTAPELKRKLFSGPSITMIGYGELPRRPHPGKDAWPVIGIAPQKHHISVYVAATKHDQPLIAAYHHKLGNVSEGKCCIRFSRFDRLNEKQWIKFIRDAVLWMDRQPAEAKPG